MKKTQMVFLELLGSEVEVDDPTTYERMDAHDRAWALGDTEHALRNFGSEECPIFSGDFIRRGDYTAVNEAYNLREAGRRP